MSLWNYFGVLEFRLGLLAKQLTGPSGWKGCPAGTKAALLYGQSRQSLCRTKTKALRGGQSEMTERTEQFRRKALECKQQADAMPDERLADEYLTLAQQWLELADQVERHGLFDSNGPAT